MTRLLVLALLIVLVSPIAASATTCAAPNHIPAGAVVTPDCTWIVEQVDPGVWRDQLDQIWTFISGFSVAVKVNLADLHIGRWLTGK